MVPSASGTRRAHKGRTSVLVIAPHPDDDAIGCGGTLARLAERGARIAVTYVTDGSASHVKSKRFPPAVLRDVREGEARAALGRLGVRRAPQFLRAPDGGLGQLDGEEQSRLAAVIARRIVRLRVHIVFAPWPRDPHPDHVATTALLSAALERCARRPAVYFYGVWLGVRGNAADRPQPGEATACTVPLRPSDLARKRAAILEHRSQTGTLIDDDPDGFRIDAALLATWLSPEERFYRCASLQAGISGE